MTKPFRLGVNYWPRKKAMYWWSRFDRGEVREELSLIQELGLDLVRIFLTWDDFQPDPGRVVTARMAELEQVLDAADGCGLDLDITFFTGHMSGPNWPPRWLLDPEIPEGRFPVTVQGQPVHHGFRNPYDDPTALRAEETLIREIVGNFQSHPAAAIWNLGNEPNIFAEPSSDPVGRAWCERWTTLIRDIGAPQPVTVGLCSDSLEQHTGLRVDEVFAQTDLAVMHGYPMYADWARDPLDQAHIPYLVALTRALTGKPVLMEEFGGPTNLKGAPSEVWRFTAFEKPRAQFMASEDEFAHYLEAVLPRLATQGALGAVLWCFADYPETLHHLPPCNEFKHERHFGLVRKDGTLKPHADIVRGFAATNPTVEPPPPTPWFDVTPQEYYEDPAKHCRRLYRRFLETET